MPFLNLVFFFPKAGALTVRTDFDSINRSAVFPEAIRRVKMSTTYLMLTKPHLIVTIFALVLPSTPLIAQTAERMRDRDLVFKQTVGAPDGHLWLKWDKLNQVLYLRGLTEGAGLGIMWAIACAQGGLRGDVRATEAFKLVPTINTPESLADLADEITKLYHDPANANIPVSSMLNPAERDIRGNPPDDIDLALRNLRQAVTVRENSSTK
jgi:hypothetical protein